MRIKTLQSFSLFSARKGLRTSVPQDSVTQHNSNQKLLLLSSLRIKMKFSSKLSLFLLTSSLCSSYAFTSPAATFVSKKQNKDRSLLKMSEKSQLEQLSEMTTLSIDSGDLKVIEKYAQTGLITDATTNPLFVSQAGLSGDPIYANMVDSAVEYAMKEKSAESDIVALAIDKLAVNLGSSIAQIVPGYVSTEVNPKYSFDTETTVERALRIIDLYKDIGIPKERILVKIAATWEGIQAAHILEEQHGIQCNLTLIFAFVQGVACAQYGAHLISPFPGRILDWNNLSKGTVGVPKEPEEDEGVICVKQMYNYYKKFSHDTICMPASWRPSRGAGFELDEIRALAGTDRMTIPAPLLEKLSESFEELPEILNEENAKSMDDIQEVGNGKITEKEFRYLMNMDGCGNDKLAEGIRAFIGETEKLEQAILQKVQQAAKV